MITRYSAPKMAGIWTEENKFEKMLEIEILVCEALARKKAIPYAAFLKIRKKARFDLKRIGEIEKTTRHDVVAFLTAVGETVGRESRFIHMGMTSSDVLDTALSLQMREAADMLIEGIEKSIAVLKKKAVRYKHTIMMGRTHGMHAEPITFGLKMAVWFAEMRRNLERMRRARKTISVGKISGVVGTFAHSSPEVETYVCRKMGLEPAPVSTQSIQRDRHAEYLNTLALIATSLEKFATEIRHLQRTEVREAEEFFGKGQKGSSAMPHKKNPIICERIAGLARVIRANAQAGMQDVVLWHERDISHSSVERIIIPDSTLLLDYMLTRFCELVEKLIVYPENMKRNMEKDKDVIFSQRILLELVNKGLSREKAYELTQRNAMESFRKEEDFKALLLKDRDVRKHLGEKEIRKCFDIKYFLRNIEKIYGRLGLR